MTFVSTRYFTAQPFGRYPDSVRSRRRRRRPASAPASPSATGRKDSLRERAAKSGGALLQQILLVVTAGTQLTIAPYLAGLVLVGLGIWFWAVFGLNKLFIAKNKEPSGGHKDKEPANIEKPSVERKSA